MQKSNLERNDPRAGW